MTSDSKHTPQRSVLLVGAGYGALKAAEDLAKSRIPVAWITRAPHFLALPGGIKGFTEWPDDLNFQFRPLYLRVTRNPLVMPLTHARIENIAPDEEGYRSAVVQDPEYIDYDKCTGCGKCMEICPLGESDNPPLRRSPNYCPSRALELDKRPPAPCRTDCPIGVNVQAYMALTAASRFEEALDIIREDNPLPGVCGRVCHHPCEEPCRRGELDEAVAIRGVKRFLADYETRSNEPRFKMPDVPGRSERVAVVGSGPAGLTAAHFLNKSGLNVTVFEEMDSPGGMLRAGINSFRLPRNVLDAEIRAIEAAGVQIRTGASVSSPTELKAEGYDAVLVCTGTHRDLKLNIPGEELNGVRHCVEFLRGVNLEGKGKVGGHTVVVGAGNSAMDAARTALRLGAAEVTVVAVETEDEFPAHPREVGESREEGVQFRPAVAPVAFHGAGGAIKSVELRPAHWEKSEKDGPMCIVYDPEETFTLDADTVIVSIGQKPGIAGSGFEEELEIGSGGRISVDEACCASADGIFASGDVVTGPSSVIDSMTSGRKAAADIYKYITGEEAPVEKPDHRSRGVGDYVEISEQTPRRWRPVTAQRQPRVRRRDFDEVDYGFTTEQAVAEAARCLQCSGCCECRVCESACEEIGAINHFREQKSFDISSPSVIVADASEVPDTGLLGMENVHYLGDLQKATDLMDILVAGSASAGQAMMKSGDLRPPSGFSEARATGEVPEELRLGFFLCTCNGAMAPQQALMRLKDFAGSVSGVHHSELITSVCNFEGAEAVAKAVREKNLTRAVVASCACCPLEFQCIACNDQRTRSRIHLFDRLGMERSRFEMLNVKDRLHREDETEDEIVERGRRLFREAYKRAKLAGPLRRGFTEIGRNIVILGGSEVGTACAANLALQGFRVRLVHRCSLPDETGPPDYIRERPVNKIGGRGITHVDEARIKEIRGHLGDFTVVYEDESGHRRRWKADIVCLTDENVLPLAIHEDMVGLKKFYRYNFAFFHTPQLGFYRVMPRTLNRVNAFEAGNALAAQVATAAAEAFLKDHELSPRVDPDRCRGCGRCADICPFDAIKLEPDEWGIYKSRVIHHNCVGCGGCVGRCPVTALDMPYFSNRALVELVAETLSGER